MDKFADANGRALSAKTSAEDGFTSGKYLTHAVTDEFT
jgi:hypothetical protein